MDMFEVAEKMEREGAAFYADLAAKAVSAGFKSIFSMLAEDETKHERTFRELAERSAPVMVPTSVTAQANSIFGGLKKQEFLAQTDQIPLYERARDIERKSIDFYTAQLDSLADETARETVGKIVSEEKRHYALLDDLVGMLSRPQAWVENAEFGVREEY